MNQEKVGALLKELRKEKGLTQDQLAEIFNVSNRSVSRWETGRNLPDISLLLEIAEFYQVDLVEILNGERKDNNMNNEIKESVEKIADYTDNQKKHLLNRVKICSIVGLISLIIGMFMQFFDVYEEIPVYSCIEGMCYGLAIGALITVILYSTSKLQQLYNRKAKHKKIILVSCLILMIVVILLSIMASI